MYSIQGWPHHLWGLIQQENVGTFASSRSIDRPFLSNSALFYFCNLPCDVLLGAQEHLQGECRAPQSFCTPSCNVGLLCTASAFPESVLGPSWCQGAAAVPRSGVRSLHLIIVPSKARRRCELVDKYLRPQFVLHCFTSLHLLNSKINLSRISRW